MNYYFIIILSTMFSIGLVFVKHWCYDGCSTSDLSDTFKDIYLIIDLIKDTVVIFFILKYLLYGTF